MKKQGLSRNLKALETAEEDEVLLTSEAMLRRQLVRLEEVASAMVQERCRPGISSRELQILAGAMNDNASAMARIIETQIKARLAAKELDPAKPSGSTAISDVMDPSLTEADLLARWDDVKG